jgi:hypothetical protein
MPPRAQLDIAEGTYLGWDAIFLTAGSLTATLVPACGGRVMQIARGGVELLYAEPRPAAWPPAPGARRYWGGSKAWLSPQAAWGGDSPEPRALDEGAWRARVTGAGDRRTVWMESPVDAATGLRLVRGVDLAAGVLSIGTRLENRGAAPAARGIWEVAQLRRPCAVTVAAAPLDPYPEEGRAPADALAAAPGGGTTVRCDRAARFKFGARAAPPVRIERLDAPVAVRLDFLPRPAPGAHFAHGGRNVEVFNSGDLPYGEVEFHAPLLALAPGEQAALSVVWTLSDP